MLIICDDKKCTGCEACKNICPQNCITMSTDVHGALHPSIDTSRCIDCKRCQKVCPNNHKVLFLEPILCLAAWDNNISDRAVCASGGLASGISRFFISELKGVVYGVKYTSDFIPQFSRASSIADLELFKGSKYVQSVIGNCYHDIKNDLSKGTFVLFIGTPCQVSGLYGYLDTRPNNLFTCDLLCHGVCPTSYFMDEINYLKKKKHIKEITDIRFRGNDAYNYRLSIWSENRILYNQSAYHQYYFRGFLKGLCLRENCYECPYAQSKRVGDFSLGDFIGLGNDIAFDGPTKNTSVVLVNTQKAVEIYGQIKSVYTNISFIERPFSEAKEHCPALKGTSPRDSRSIQFRKSYLKKGYIRSSRSIMRGEIYKESIVGLYYKIHHQGHLLLKRIFRQ